ncbi:hypothetical protein LCGC14_0967620 [marine sediment metagenome]|uniref:Uncharacterized protein n=1 Tax=marine sediment metagenome TaxID=412755 RepID=A0A0F9QVT9_9ZZZZ
MKIIKSKNYEKSQKKSETEKGCRECGNLAYGHNHLCQKCQEEEERRKERYKE